MAEDGYIKVQREHEEEAIELPLEEDSTLLLSTLSATFPEACGLKYRPDGSERFRALRARAGALLAPTEGWQDTVYVVVASNPDSHAKRSVEASAAGDHDLPPAKRDPGEAADRSDEDRERYDARNSEREDANGGGGGDGAAKDEAKDKDKGGDGGSRHARESRKCYVCGGVDHIASVCTSPQNSMDDPTARECHLCHGRGHIKANCPLQRSRSVCYKCNGFGHLARNCPSAVGAPASGYAADWRGYSSGRFPASQSSSIFGYMAPFVSSASRSGGSPGGSGSRDYSRGSSSSDYRSEHRYEGRDSACYSCGGYGHRAAECPHYSSAGGYYGGGSGGGSGGGAGGSYYGGSGGASGASGGTKSNVCFICNQPGHLARDCALCRICKMEGHRSFECPQRRT